MHAVVIIVSAAVADAMAMPQPISEVVEAIKAKTKSVGKRMWINRRPVASRIKIARCDDRSVAPSVPVWTLKPSTAYLFPRRIG